LKPIKIFDSCEKLLRRRRPWLGGSSKYSLPPRRQRRRGGGGFRLTGLGLGEMMGVWDGGMEGGWS